MILENEVIAFVLAIGVLFFFFSTRARLRELPAWTLFLATFCVCTAGWFFTIVEGVWAGFPRERELQILFNAAEHLCYAASSLLFTLWCWKAFDGRKDRP